MRYATRLLAGVAACLFAQAGTQPDPAIAALKQLAAVEAAARLNLARPTDPDAARMLAEEVFAVPHWAVLPTEVLIPLKAQFADAEVEYWRGTNKGVEEADIEKFVNLLASRLGLPAFARTSTSQIRVLRMQSVASMPVFMGRGMSRLYAHGRPKLGESISSTLSPLQAFQLIQNLIDQKFYNPAYQVSPEEWDQGRPQRHLFALRRPTGAQGGEAAGENDPLASRGELEARLSESLSSMSMLEGLAILDKGLKLLRIR